MYKITIEKLTEEEGKSYFKKEELYTQIVEEINIKKVIDAVNPFEI